MPVPPPQLKPRTRKGTGREPWHGTTNGWTYHRCNCPRCTAAWNVYTNDYAARQKTKPLPDHIDPDSYEGYRRGSKTPGALAANAARVRAQRAARKK